MVCGSQNFNVKIKNVIQLIIDITGSTWTLRKHFITIPTICNIEIILLKKMVNYVNIKSSETIIVLIINNQGQNFAVFRNGM